MSAYLKQHVPRGSLGAERVQAPAESPADGKDRELVQMGWKLQSLNSAADSLIESATRLGTEMEQEGRYWEEVLAIDRKKWSLCRMPRERHTLGVRFGFLEGEDPLRQALCNIREASQSAYGSGTRQRLQNSETVDWRHCGVEKEGR